MTGNQWSILCCKYTVYKKIQQVNHIITFYRLYSCFFDFIFSSSFTSVFIFSYDLKATYMTVDTSIWAYNHEVRCITSYDLYGSSSFRRERFGATGCSSSRRRLQLGAKFISAKSFIWNEQNFLLVFIRLEIFSICFFFQSYKDKFEKKQVWEKKQGWKERSLIKTIFIN